jgi:hypothetical protein
MIGSWRWNAIAAAVFSVLIFLLSLSNNPIGTAGYRAGVTFVILFIVTFAVRWLLGQAMVSSPKQHGGAHDSSPQDEDGKGQSIDIVTPDGVGEELSLPFSPLTPPKLTRTEEALDPQRLAEALRHMSEK